MGVNGLFEHLRAGYYGVGGGNSRPEEMKMSILWMIIAALVAFWVIGMVMNLAGSLVHVLLVVAAVLFVVNMLAGGRTRV